MIKLNLFEYDDGSEVIVEEPGKRCNRCKQWKPFTEFHVRKKSKDGRDSWCNRCKHEYDMELYSDDEKRKLKNEKNKEWYNQPDVREYYVNDYNKRPEVIKGRRESQKKRMNDPIKRKHINKIRNESAKNRRKTDSMFKFKTDVRGTINSSLTLRGYTKKSKAYEILGISYDEFREWLEKDGLSIDDVGNAEGQLHKDHIVPLALGSNEEEIIILNHYTNWRLIDNFENESKKDNLPSIFELPPEIHPKVFEIFMRAI